MPGQRTIRRSSGSGGVAQIYNTTFGREFALPSPNDYLDLGWYEPDTQAWQDTGFTTAATADNDPIGGLRKKGTSGPDFTQATAIQKPALKLSVAGSRAVARFSNLPDSANSDRWTFTELTTIRTVYIVFKHGTGFSMPNTNESILGHSSVSDFRGFAGTDLFSGSCSAAVLNGDIYWNNFKLSAVKYAGKPVGFSCIVIVTTGNTSLSQICNALNQPTYFMACDIASIGFASTALNNTARTALYSYAVSRFSLVKLPKFITNGNSLMYGNIGTGGLNVPSQVIAMLAADGQAYDMINPALVGLGIDGMITDIGVTVNNNYDSSVLATLSTVQEGSNWMNNGGNDAAGYISEVQTYITALHSGIVPIVVTIPARNDASVYDAAAFDAKRQTANGLLISNFVTYGGKSICDWGGDVRFNSLSAALSATYYNADHIHHTDAGDLIKANYLACAVKAARTNRATIRVIDPNGGESWASGSTQKVHWAWSSVTNGGIANMKIEVSTNGGASYSSVSGSTTNNGEYTWTVPATPSANCLIRISDALDSTVNDVSDAVFTIT